MKFNLLFCFISYFLTSVASAQEKSKIKFGKVSAEDFSITSYPVDPTADAVVIAEIGSSEFEGNKKGDFSVVFKKFRRVHILKKNGYSAANVEFAFYTKGEMEEELSSLKAYTYNLENGKVVSTKLETKSAVFKDRINKNWVVRKFTFPNIKEGSIIEYEMKLTSDFTFNLQSWTFQGEYPCLWSEYTVGMPEFYNYVTLSQGYQKFYIKDQKDKVDNFTVVQQREGSGFGTSGGDMINFSAGVTDFRWVMKDVPAIKEESFTSTIQNHLAKIEFQLAELRGPIYIPKSYMNTWEQTTEQLMKDEFFGASITADNFWLDDYMKDATRGATTQLGKARNIFTYLQDNMICTNYNRLYLEKPLKSIIKARSGNEAEINLLLIAMLRKAGISADPVMLSTRSHKVAYAAYPLIDRFNYIVCRAWIDGKYYFLDASKQRLGFGKLDYDCYNGHARIINGQATPVELVADSLREIKLTSVFMNQNEQGQFTGQLSKTHGYYESLNLRNRFTEKGKEQLAADIRKSINSEVTIRNYQLDSLYHNELPVTSRFDFDFPVDNADIIYFNPMLGEGWKENPFKSATRRYPVEMPYAIDEIYLLRMDIPKGYVIDELPQQVMVKLNDREDGMFEFRLAESNGAISLRSRIQLKRAYYSPEEYDVLREFFNLIVKKHNEQIVFKKK